MPKTLYEHLRAILGPFPLNLGGNIPATIATHKAEQSSHDGNPQSGTATEQSRAVTAWPSSYDRSELKIISYVVDLGILAATILLSVALPKK